MRTLFLIAASGTFSFDVLAQDPLSPVTPSRQIEPGLEAAVDWKWWVVPSDGKSWGLPIEEPEPPEPSPATPTSASAPDEPRPTQYEVKRGDALSLVARRFGMTSHQLKTFNKLTSDTIKIGQVLWIPTLEEVKTLFPAPPPPLPSASSGKNKAAAAAKPAPPQPEFSPPGQEDLLLQVYLDRAQFSSGPIDGNAGPTFAKMLQLYRSVHPELIDLNALKRHAEETMGSPYTRYTLRAEDFRFIEAPGTNAPLPAKKSPKSAAKPVEAPPPAYPDLIAAPLLAYRTPWEFVAERFHCSEAFLRQMNPRIKGNPSEGTEFQVPNVIPFEIEKAPEELKQPAADPQSRVTAALVELSRLEVYRDGTLVAVAPIGLARPDLRGRGSWTILDFVPCPRLATLQELRNPPKSAAPVLSEDLQSVARPQTALKAILPSEQYLPPGPNNPVGILWIHLSKVRSTEPLPYGLHGTSIPGRMKSQEGIGGIRLTNWDIARLARLLPPGTPLQWK